MLEVSLSSSSGSNSNQFRGGGALDQPCVAETCILCLYPVHPTQRVATRAFSVFVSESERSRETLTLPSYRHRPCFIAAFPRVSRFSFSSAKVDVARAVIDVSFTRNGTQFPKLPRFEIVSGQFAKCPRSTYRSNCTCRAESRETPRSRVSRFRLCCTADIYARSFCDNQMRRCWRSIGRFRERDPENLTRNTVYCV